MFVVDLPHSRSKPEDIARFGRDFGDLCLSDYCGYTINWPQDVYDWLIETGLWGNIFIGREPAPGNLYSARFENESDFTLFKLAWL